MSTIQHHEVAKRVTIIVSATVGLLIFFVVLLFSANSSDATVGHATTVIGPASDDTQCVDVDMDDVFVAANTTGFDIIEQDGLTQKLLVTKSDSCIGDSEVIEYVCGQNNLVEFSIHSCPDNMECRQGACHLPLIFTLANSSKEETLFVAEVDVSVGFWVVTTLFDTQDKPLSFTRAYYQPLTAGETLTVESAYPYLENVGKKEITIYDVANPDAWTVYLDPVFVEEYDTEQ